VREVFKIHVVLGRLETELIICVNQRLGTADDAKLGGHLFILERVHTGISCTAGSPFQIFYKCIMYVMGYNDSIFERSNNSTYS
jgi:hypothetical protein